MALNPFISNRPLGPDELIDRDAEAARLLELAEGSQSARLSAPRQYGKTTLLRRLLLDADKAGFATVYVDFYGVVSIEDISIRIEEAYEQSLKGALAQWFTALARTWNPRLRAGIAGRSLSPSRRGGCCACSTCHSRCRAGRGGGRWSSSMSSRISSPRAATSTP
jgi:hypothetical protein